MTYTYTNSFSVGGIGINGATISAYKASRFSSVPAFNGAGPGGSPDATATTGDAAGFDGAFAVALPTSEDYYIAVSYVGNTYWLGPVSQVFADGTGALGGAAIAGTLAVPPFGIARSASATANAGEQTIATGTTASQTLTLPASTVQASTVNTIQNISTQVWTIAAGAGTTLNYNGTVGSFLLAPNTMLQLALIGTVWVAIDYSGIGAQVAINQVTANFTNTTATGNTFALANHTSGTSPTITLPNDGRVYRVEFTAVGWNTSVADQCFLAIGTSTTVRLATIGNATMSTTESPLAPLVVPNATGSGQVLNIYSCSGTTGHTVTVIGGTGDSVCSLAAYRVG